MFLMVSNEDLGLYIVISFAASVLVNILCYRLIFRKMKRMRANGFSWLLTLGVMLGANFGFLYIYIPGFISEIFNLFPGEQILAYLIAPITWFVFPLVYLIIRAIFIRITKNREREVLSKEIEEAEFVVNHSTNDETQSTEW
jgi:hypothetical protein